MNYEWSFGDRNSCPTSDHPKKMHRGNRIARRTVVKEHKGFGKNAPPFKSTSYVDTVVCAFCGLQYEQEWMPAGF